MRPAYDPLQARKRVASAKKATRSRKKIGRRGGIRTRDPLHPMQVRYQAALHADKTEIITRVGTQLMRVDASMTGRQQLTDLTEFAPHQQHLL
jgi:hypothetical protein